MNRTLFALFGIVSISLIGIAHAGSFKLLGIVGGQLLQAGGSTVLVTVPNSEDNPVHCTGVVIDRDAILTAAHCLGQGLGQGPVQSPGQGLAPPVGLEPITLHFTQDLEEKDTPSRKVKSGITHERFQLGDLSTPDLAVLHFDGGLPPGYAPVTLATDAIEIKAGDLLYLAGYGRTEINSPVPTGTLGVLHGDYFPVANPLATYDEMSFKVDSHHSTATGDSGGPAYWVGTERVILVGISKNIIYYQNDWRWVDRAHYTRVGPYRNWILATMAQLRARAAVPTTLSPLPPPPIQRNRLDNAGGDKKLPTT